MTNRVQYILFIKKKETNPPPNKLTTKQTNRPTSHHTRTYTPCPPTQQPNAKQHAKSSISCTRSPSCWYVCPIPLPTYIYPYTCMYITNPDCVCWGGVLRIQAWTERRWVFVWVWLRMGLRLRRWGWVFQRFFFVCLGRGRDWGWWVFLGGY